MNGQDRVMIARLETKVDFIKSAIKEIKKKQDMVTIGCTAARERMAKLEQKMCDHVKVHDINREISGKRMAVYVSVVAVVVSIIVSIVT